MSLILFLLEDWSNPSSTNHSAGEVQLRNDCLDNNGVHSDGDPREAGKHKFLAGECKCILTELLTELLVLPVPQKVMLTD